LRDPGKRDPGRRADRTREVDSPTAAGYSPSTRPSRGRPAWWRGADRDPPWKGIDATMKIKERQRDGVMILELSGKIMGGPDAERFSSTLKSLIHEGVRHVVVDLKEVTWVNSTGLGILISGYTTMKRNNGEMKLLNVSERIDSIFMVTKLYSVFESYRDEDEAVASFAAR
jgi:anti-sigma B factor antagonist